ncbi:MAG: HEAT repeat domain-containing protein [Bacteroidota bacterium]
MNRIIAEIRELESQNNTDELGGYLTNLVKSEKNPQHYENEFKKHLNSDNWYLKKTAIFCLLFALQIDKPEYRKKAIEFVSDLSEDDEVRRWSISGLGQTYRNTNDNELIKLFLRKIDDKNDDESLKSSLVSSILNICGISSHEQFMRTGKINNSAAFLIESFEKEFELIKNRIN